MIDACVIIASPVERNLACAGYLSKLTLQHHGCLTHLLIGEIVNGVCSHIPRREVREQLYAYLDELIVEKRISILPIKRIPPEDISELQEALPFLSEDDAIHLAEMRTHGISEFVTIDKELTNQRNKQRLAQKGIRIINPQSGDV